MRHRGRKERYISRRVDAEKQYPGMGGAERRGSRGPFCNASVDGRNLPQVALAGQLRARGIAWPTLGEGYRRKERRRTGQQQYAMVYTPGRVEPETIKRTVGTKIVLTALGRPSKERKVTAKGRQEPNLIWDLVDRERSRAFRRAKGRRAEAGEREPIKSGRRVWQKRRRRCERARNLYEYSSSRILVGTATGQWFQEEPSREGIGIWESKHSKNGNAESVREHRKIATEASRVGYGDDARAQREWHREEMILREERIEGAPWLGEAGEVQRRREASRLTIAGSRTQGSGRIAEGVVYIG
jgi:hypothetical protein